jgi:hypothetical protein
MGGDMIRPYRLWTLETEPLQEMMDIQVNRSSVRIPSPEKKGE